MPENPTPPEPLCEFTNPCTTASETTTTTDGKKNAKNPSNPRKVISHIFGRNKTSTKLFPTSVWVHYCRKHYQRARYRSTQWPFTQCELLLDSLARMERWGGVRCFELVLRRREVERVDGDHGSVSAGAGGGSGAGRGGRLLRSQARIENGEDEDEGSASTLTSASNNTNADDGYTSSSTNSNTNTKGKSKTKSKSTKQRKTPLIEPAPVPDWLRLEVGGNKSFDDIRDIIHRLSDYLTHLREQGRRDEIRFPDVEILPEFRRWVLRDAAAASAGESGGDEEGRGDGVGGHKRGKGRGKGRNVGRVSGRGAVQKA